jgi:hypothetical protein
LALLLKFAGREFASKHYQRFKWDVVAKWPIDESFNVDEKMITSWIERIKREETLHGERQ